MQIKRRASQAVLILTIAFFGAMLGATAQSTLNPVTLFQSAVNSNIVTNGKGQITGAKLNSVLNALPPIFNSMGTWNSAGAFQGPVIPNGFITQAMLQPGVGGGSDASALTTGKLNPARLPAFTGPDCAIADGVAAINCAGLLATAHTFTALQTFYGTRQRSTTITAAGDVTVTTDYNAYHLKKSVTEATRFNFNCSTLTGGVADFSFLVIDDNAIDSTAGFAITLTATATGGKINGQTNYTMNTSRPANGTTVNSEPDRALIVCDPSGNATK